MEHLYEVLDILDTVQMFLDNNARILGTLHNQNSQHNLVLEAPDLGFPMYIQDATTWKSRKSFCPDKYHRSQDILH
jgi:hypothetical protein